MILKIILIILAIIFLKYVGLLDVLLRFLGTILKKIGLGVNSINSIVKDDKSKDIQKRKYNFYLKNQSKNREI